MLANQKLLIETMQACHRRGPGTAYAEHRDVYPLHQESTQQPALIGFRDSKKLISNCWGLFACYFWQYFLQAQWEYPFPGEQSVLEDEPGRHQFRVRAGSWSSQGRCFVLRCASPKASAHQWNPEQTPQEFACKTIFASAEGHEFNVLDSPRCFNSRSLTSLGRCEEVRIWSGDAGQIDWDELSVGVGKRGKISLSQHWKTHFLLDVELSITNRGTKKLVHNNPAFGGPVFGLSTTWFLPLLFNHVLNTSMHLTLPLQIFLWRNFCSIDWTCLWIPG